VALWWTHNLVDNGIVHGYKNKEILIKSQNFKNNMEKW
jgi:hypothetical protein